jgi:branched-chain amino acid transport system ATP-binding protein
VHTFQNIRLFRDLTVFDNVRVSQYHIARYHPIEALLHIERYHREERRLLDDALRLLADPAISEAYLGEAKKSP